MLHPLFAVHSCATLYLVAAHETNRHARDSYQLLIDFCPVAVYDGDRIHTPVPATYALQRHDVRVWIGADRNVG